MSTNLTHTLTEVRRLKQRSGEVVSIVRNTMQLQSHSAMEEAAHFGLHAMEGTTVGGSENEGTLLELMTYRKFSSRKQIGAALSQSLTRFDHQITRKCVPNTSHSKSPSNKQSSSIVPLHLSPPALCGDSQGTSSIAFSATRQFIWHHGKQGTVR